MKTYLKTGCISAFVVVLMTGAGHQVSAPAAQCAAGDRLLPISGLCASQAAKLMPAADPFFAEGLSAFNCKPAINETSFFSDVLLYHAAQCGGAPVTLEASAGARSGSLTVLKGGIHGDKPEPFEIGKILVSDPAMPSASLEGWTRQVMESEGFSAAAIKNCRARKVEGARDSWVVDEYTAANLPGPLSDGPRSACGRYGYTEESNAEWRIAHGHAWFVDFGQDAYTDFDFRSLTVITKAGKGWIGLSTGGAAPALAQPAPSKLKTALEGLESKPDTTPVAGLGNATYSGSNIANVSGVMEAHYGETRGWTVYSGKARGALRYCVGEKDYSGTRLRIGFDGGQWQFAVPYPVNPDYYGQFEVDGKNWGMSGTADAKWTFAWVGLPELDAIRNGNVMILDIGRASLDFELVGTAAVITKVEECVKKGM